MKPDKKKLALIVLVVAVLIVMKLISGGTAPADVSYDQPAAADHGGELILIGDESSPSAEEAPAAEIPAEEPEATPAEPEEEGPQLDPEALKLKFRNDKLLSQHYDKHGKEMGFDSKESYQQAAAKVVANPEALHKTEAEDGDDVYYLVDTNEFVIVSGDGYIRTYFLPSAGLDYYNRQ